MKTILITIITLATFLGSLSAAPCSNSIPMPINYMGMYTGNDKYQVQFDSVFGVHWDIKGWVRESKRLGSYTDSFNGTVSDTKLEGTFTRNDFDWLSDGWYLCMHQWIECTSVSLTISDGKVTGYATFKAP